MSTLARVEVQAIMHFLNRRDLSRLARCSRRMYADADEKAAWKHVRSRLVIDRSALRRGLVQGILAGGLFFRHWSHVAIRCELGDAADVAAAMSAMHSLAHLEHLLMVVSKSISYTVQQWRAMFDQLPVEDLLVLDLRDCGAPALVESMASWLPRMTRLHTLRLDDGCWPRPLKVLHAPSARWPT